MIELIICICIGIVAVLTGVVGGFLLCMYSFFKGANVIDRMYHDKAPFDKELENTEPLDSHVDGGYMDNEVSED